MKAVINMVSLNVNSAHRRKTDEGENEKAFAIAGEVEDSGHVSYLHNCSA